MKAEEDMKIIERILESVGFKGKKPEEVIGMKCMLAPKDGEHFAVSEITGFYYGDEILVLGLSNNGSTFETVTGSHDGDWLGGEDGTEVTLKILN